MCRKITDFLYFSFVISLFFICNQFIFHLLSVYFSFVISLLKLNEPSHDKICLCYMQTRDIFKKIIVETNRALLSINKGSRIVKRFKMS